MNHGRGTLSCTNGVVNLTGIIRASLFKYVDVVLQTLTENV